MNVGTDDQIRRFIGSLNGAELAELLDGCSHDELEALAEILPRLDADDRRGAPRPSYPWQQPPAGDWWGWAITGGRGIGKTLGAASWCDLEAQHFPGIRFGIIAPTKPDARATCVEGETGLLAVNPEINFNRSNLEGAWPNGSQFRCFGAYTNEDRQRLRGPQWHRAWLEEFAAWRQLDEHPRDDDPDAWQHVTFALRLGERQRFVMTSTPKRRKRYREVVRRRDVAVTRGTTYEAHGLAQGFRNRLLEMYEGTRLGQQELLGEELDDVEGALWTTAGINRDRVQAHPPLAKIRIGVDPAGSSTSGVVGIVAAGLSAQRWPHPSTGRPVRHGYVLADASLSGPPEVWARAAIDLAHDLQADEIVAETNYGGEMVASTIRAVDSTVPVRVVTASRGKKVRAEPVAAVASQGLLHHVGDLPLLEEEQTTYVEEYATWSPNRLDALVWAVTPGLDQMGGRGDPQVSSPTGSRSDVQTGKTPQTRRQIER